MVLLIHFLFSVATFCQKSTCPWLFSSAIIIIMVSCSQFFEEENHLQEKQKWMLIGLLLFWRRGDPLSVETRDDTMDEDDACRATLWLFFTQHEPTEHKIPFFPPDTNRQTRLLLLPQNITRPPTFNSCEKRNSSRSNNNHQLFNF